MHRISQASDYLLCQIKPVMLTTLKRKSSKHTENLILEEKSAPEVIT